MNAKLPLQRVLMIADRGDFHLYQISADKVPWNPDIHHPSLDPRDSVKYPEGNQVIEYYLDEYILIIVEIMSEFIMIFFAHHR